MNGAARDVHGAHARNGARPTGSASPRSPATFCPRCGERYATGSFVQEYWTSERRVFSCWCAQCRYVCDVVEIDRVLSFEPEH